MNRTQLLSLAAAPHSGLPVPAAAPAPLKSMQRPRLAAQLGHAGRVNAVVYSPDGRWLLTGSNDGTARLWDAASGRELRSLKGYTSAVMSVAFSPDGKRLASGSADNTVKVWDAQTGQQILTLKGHTNDVTGVAFSPDSKRIVSGSADKTVKVWDATQLP